MEITSFVWSSRINLLHVKRNSDRLVVVAKVFLKLPITYQILVYANKINNAILSFILRYLFLCYIIFSQKLGSSDSWWIANSVIYEGNSATPFLFNGNEVRCSTSNKLKLFAKNFVKTQVLMFQVPWCLRYLRNSWNW